MKVKTISTVFFLMLGSMLSASYGVEAGKVQAETTTPQPGVVCVNPLFDFGPVYSDAVVKHSYVLTNQGPHTVKVIAVRTRCGCATATAATNAIAPGQSSTVDVVITFKGRRGRLTKSIYTETDDPLNRIMKMDFTGVVIVPVEVQPEGVHFGTVGSDERLEREVLVTAIETNTFQVLAVKSPSSNLLVSVETREKGKQYVVKMVCTGPRKQGTFMTSVEVETDHPNMKTFSIPVAGFVGGEILLSPAVLLLTPSETNAPRSVWVNIWSPAGKPFKVTKVQLPGEGMTNSVMILRPDRSRMEIKTWGALTGLDQKSIRIETDLPAMKELLLPVKVLTAREEKTGMK